MILLREKSKLEERRDFCKAASRQSRKLSGKSHRIHFGPVLKGIRTVCGSE